MKRRATEDHIHKYRRIDQESIGSAHSTPGAYQHQNSPPPSQPTVAAIHDPKLTSHAILIQPVNYGGDSNQGPMAGDFLFQNLVLIFLDNSII